MAIDLSQFYQAFFAESVEHLEAMEQLLLELNLDDPDPEELNAIFRAAHSIKGSSGTFGFTDIAETTHFLENLLDRIRKRELAIRPDMVDVFLDVKDLLNRMLNAHQGQEAVDSGEVNALCERLQSLSGGAQNTPAGLQRCKSPEITIRVYMIEFVPTGKAVGDGVKALLEGLATFGSLDIVNQPDQSESSSGQWLLRLATECRAEEFAGSLDFIAKKDSWRIVDEASWQNEATVTTCQKSTADDDGSFYFFDPLLKLPDGLATVAVVTSPQTLHDEGYGFFEPLVEPKSEPPVVSAVQETETDGYGFFAPLQVSAPPVQIAAESGKTAATELLKAPENKTANQPAIPARSITAASSDSSIRVSVEKVDQLINLVGELVITQAMLMQTAVQMQESTSENLMLGLTQLERNTRDMQESVMSIRMLPISFVFSRFPRVVRDLSGKLGKKVELKLSGENTELDKSLIERIADPLTHLVRNSLDHGIESPEIRQAAGKHPVGTITLKAYHQGGNIVIEVGDDGAGINRQKILAKARERGIQVSDQMSDQDVFALIFDAGFSTAELVTDVSGRGVGMDVVRRNIQGMGGRVEIESMLGIGTRMTVRLPLTLAILDGMSVAVGDQIYILPLSTVVESLQPKSGEVKTMANQGRVIQVRNEYLPLVVLHEVFGLKTEVTDFTQGIMVILDANGIKAALFVDALLGQHQVVIKSLEANYRRVDGISGATIMGDGHVAMILDASAIAGMTKTSMNSAAA
ncbi:MAG: chemotaxis protein CheW [Betaproteobacteria bacterium]